MKLFEAETETDVDFLKKDLLWQIEKDLEENPHRYPPLLGEAYTPYGLKCAAEEELESLIKLGFVGMPYLEEERPTALYGIGGVQGTYGSQGTMGTQGTSSFSGWSTSGTGSSVGGVMTTSTTPSGAGYTVYGGGGGSYLETGTTVKLADGSWKIV